MPSFPDSTPISEYRALSHQMRDELMKLHINTLAEFKAMLGTGDGRDHDTAVFDKLKISPGMAERMRKELRIATGENLHIKPEHARILERFRPIALSLGPKPNPGRLREEVAKVIREVSAVAKTQAPSANDLAREGALRVSWAGSLIEQGKLEQGMKALLATVPRLRSDTILNELQDGRNIRHAVTQTAAAVESVLLAAKQNQIYSLERAVEDLDQSSKLLRSVTSGINSQTMVAQLIFLYSSKIQFLTLSLRDFLIWLAAKLELLGEVLLEILELIFLLYDFYQWMAKYEAAVVYCYSFCGMASGTSEVPANFMECVAQCFEDGGGQGDTPITVPDAFWDVIKTFGPGAILDLIDP